MEELKEKYESVVTKRKVVIEELNNLKENELVKRYIELLEQKSSLYIQQERLYVELKNKEYENCNHIWITSKIDRDYMEGRSYCYEGCIKCGLTTEVFSDLNGYGFLSGEEKIMHNFLKRKGNNAGINSNKVCDLELAKAIYKKIHDALPDLDLEVFVHGALCYSYSGQCLFSALEYGKSANRGRCVYPCRNIYEKNDGNSVFSAGALRMFRCKRKSCLHTCKRQSDSGNYRRKRYFF